MTKFLEKENPDFQVREGIEEGEVVLKGQHEVSLQCWNYSSMNRMIDTHLPM